MIRIGLKGLWAHKRRLTGTVLAIFLGTAFLSGTLVLGDTLKRNFDTIFAQATGGTDVVVRSTSQIEADSGGQRGLIDASLLDRIRQIDGVADAQPEIRGYGQLIGSDGQAIGGNGPPRIAGNWILDPALNPYRLESGRAPFAPNEVVINQGAAEAGDLHIGDDTTIQAPEPHRVRIVGIVTFGTVEGLGKATFTAFTLEGAERYVTKQPGRLSAILVRAAPGVSQSDLAARIGSTLPTGVEAFTGSRYTQETIDRTTGPFVALFRTFVLVFAGIALLVAMFSINNAFSIIHAQRARESALLRAVGAKRSQILVSVVLEALAVGVVASVAGLFGGAGIAGLLKGVFDSFGFALPASGLVFKGSTVAITLGVGVVVTVIAALAPAVRASRVLPLAALRDMSVDRTGVSRSRAVIGVVLTVIGGGAALSAVLGGSGHLGPGGLGAVLLIVGVVALGPIAAAPVGAIIGSPISRLRGVTGQLARENAVRNPRRTAGTATALMVGVAVVSLFTVVVASLNASIQEGVSRSFRGDLVIAAPSFGGGGLSPELATTVSALPEVRSAVGLSTEPVRIDGTSRFVSVADPEQLSVVLDLGAAIGSIRGLGDGEIAVSKAAADDHGWHVGTPVRIGFADGATGEFRIGAIYDATEVVGDYLLPQAAWAPHAIQQTDQDVFIALAGGVGLRTGEAAVEKVAKSFGAAAVQDRQEYVASVASSLNLLLGIVYVMLALAIVIALMGIANTLSLSIHERIRELGLLRAVGATRGQVRSMVRWESVIIALFGTIGGLSLGVFLGWALVQAASTRTIAVFSAPPGRLIAVLVVGAIAGVVAGLRPARRAARLNLMEAIAIEE